MKTIPILFALLSGLPALGEVADDSIPVVFLGDAPLPAGIRIREWTSPNDNGERLAVLQKEGEDGWESYALALVGETGRIQWINRSYSGSERCSEPNWLPNFRWLGKDRYVTLSDARHLEAYGFSRCSSPVTEGVRADTSDPWFPEALQSGNSHMIFQDCVAKIDTLDLLEPLSSSPDSFAVCTSRKDISVTICRDIDSQCQVGRHLPASGPESVPLAERSLKDGERFDFISAANSKGLRLALIHQEGFPMLLPALLLPDGTVSGLSLAYAPSDSLPAWDGDSPRSMYWVGDKRVVFFSSGHMNTICSVMDLQGDKDGTAHINCASSFGLRGPARLFREDDGGLHVVGPGVDFLIRHRPEPLVWPPSDEGEGILGDVR